MSRRPGIGATYYEKYKKEIWSTDSVPVGNGKTLRPRMYYFRKLKDEDPEKYREISINRLKNMVDNDPFRLEDKDYYARKINEFWDKVYKKEI